jgi:hypothetical protein
MIIQNLIKWLMKNLRILLSLFQGKKIRYGLFFNSLFLAISLMKRFKTFRFVRWIILGLGIANLIFSVFIIISFSDIDFSKFEIPTLSMILSIIIGLVPVFFTDSWFYIYQGMKASAGTFLSGIIGNIVTTPEYNFEAKYLNGVTELKYDEYFDEYIPKEDQDTEINKSNYTKYLLILAAVTTIGTAIGIVYYYHPEYYTIMFEYFSNIFNRRGGDPDPDSGPSNSTGNNNSNNIKTGEAVRDIMSRTLSKINSNSSSSKAYLRVFEENHGFSYSDDFLNTAEEMISRNNKTLENFRKLPIAVVSKEDYANYIELLSENSKLKYYVDRDRINITEMPSTSYPGVKPESSISPPSSPETVPENLLSSQETIKPKSSQTYIDSFFPKRRGYSNLPSTSYEEMKPESPGSSLSSEDKRSITLEDSRTDIENYPSIPKTEEGFNDSASTTGSFLDENKAKLKNIFKRFGSKKPPVGETTVNPDYTTSTKGKERSIIDYPPVPDND